jgi:hypothetical protein
LSDCFERRKRPYDEQTLRVYGISRVTRRQASNRDMSKTAKQYEGILLITYLIMRKNSLDFETFKL